MKRIIRVPRDEERSIMENLSSLTDLESERIRRYYRMPDLSRTPGNPVSAVVEKVLALPRYRSFDVMETPEIVWIHETFDLFGFRPDHPARSKSDTYYVGEDRILRTHTTILWYYYLRDPQVLRELERDGEIGVVSYGKVYRKDEIDRKHMNVFHQIDGLYLCEKSKQAIGRDQLVDVLMELTTGLFGEDVEYRVLDDSFPYTDPSVQIEIMVDGEWMEILGSGVIRGGILRNLGIDPDRYNWWAFGPGIERLAMIAKRIPDIRILWSEDPRIVRQWRDLATPYEEVSKYPSTFRDISFVLDSDRNLNDYYGIVQDIAGDLVEEVTLLDRYEHAEKLGQGKTSYTWRIVYRALERTLRNDEVNEMQEKIREATARELSATLR